MLRVEAEPWGPLTCPHAAPYIALLFDMTILYSDWLMSKYCVKMCIIACFNDGQMQ